MPDWNKIKAEYIADDKASYRNLVAKYGVPMSALRRRAKKEQWPELRAQARHKANTRIVNSVVRKIERRAGSVDTAADMLIDAVTGIIMGGSELNPQEIKQLTGALKDLRDIKGLRTEADLREQEARIRKLEKEAAGDAADNTVTVVFGGGADEYAK